MTLYLSQKMMLKKMFLKEIWSDLRFTAIHIIIRKSSFPHFSFLNFSHGGGCKKLSIYFFFFSDSWILYGKWLIFHKTKLKLLAIIIMIKSFDKLLFLILSWHNDFTRKILKLFIVFASINGVLALFQVPF